MQIRRCKVVYLEPRETVTFDLADLLVGGGGAKRERQWIALAPHLGREHVVDVESREILGQLSPEQWVDAEALPAQWGPVLERLVEIGLVLAREPASLGHGARDEALRRSHWHPLSALAHGLTRWSGVDAVEAMQRTGTETADKLRDVLGAPPPERAQRADIVTSAALPRIGHDGFDHLLRRRATCRNFDTARPLPLHLLAQLMQRVFAAQAVVQVTDDTLFLKKNCPSGGGLHPVDAYLVVRDVEGIDPGLYYYDAMEHALGRLPDPEMPLEKLLCDAVAGQQWFADAHAMAVMAPRYARNFWKYRQHAKAYRAVLLEAGHLSQLLYLSATEAGLAAYVTCAINEVCLDEALGLDAMNEGVLAICGFGWRAEAMETMELDPLGTIWGH
jgi:putative peptide maturation dehydrogenase